MQDGFLFDNIYIGHSIEDAMKLAEETWKVKYDLEKAAEPVEPESTYAEKAQGYLQIVLNQLEILKEQTLEFIEMAKVDPLDAVKTLPHMAVILGLSSLIPILLISAVFGGKKEESVQAPVPTKKIIKEEAKAESSPEKESKTTKRSKSTSKKE